MRLGSALLAALLTGCSLVVSVDGLSGGSDAADGGGTGTLSEAGPNDVPDGAFGDAIADVGGGGDGAAPAFTDDFDRADGPPGNGWIEKTPGRLVISGGHLVPTSGDYRDGFDYRANDDLTDVELGVELAFSMPPEGDPQLLVRLQHATLAQPGAFDGYVCWIGSAGTVIKVGRENGGTLSALAQTSFSSPLATSSVHRLRCRVTGQSPVQIVGIVEKQAGVTWTEVSRASFADSSPQRITKSGTVALGNNTAPVFTFDNFSRTAL